jgi:hypothetical protein
MRKATIDRKTKETQITAEVALDGTGRYDVKTGIGFLDHMLEQLARHSLMDITLRADGDLHVDQRVTGQLLQHVVEEADAGLDVVAAGSVKRDLGGDLRFLGLAVDRCFSHSKIPKGKSFGRCRQKARLALHAHVVIR